MVGFVTALFVDSALTGTLACVDELRLLLHVCGDGLCYSGQQPTRKLCVWTCTLFPCRNHGVEDRCDKNKDWRQCKG